MSVDLIHLWGTMGWFAKGVVIIMAFMSIWSLTIMIQKVFQFHGQKRKFFRVFLRLRVLLSFLQPRHEGFHQLVCRDPYSVQSFYWDGLHAVLPWLGVLNRGLPDVTSFCVLNQVSSETSFLLQA